MKIYGIVKTSTVDYPAKIVTTIFLGGCNFNCEYCHNHELISPDPLAETMSEDEVFKLLLKRKGLIDGICISGGEAALYGNELVEFMREIKEKLGNEFLIKLDTNGSKPEIIEQIKSYVDYVAMDFKAIDYTKFSSITKETVLKTLDEIKKNIPDYEVRITMYPPYIKLTDISKIAEELKGVKKVYIQEYKVVKGASDEKYSLEELNEVVNVFVKAGIECELRC